MKYVVDTTNANASIGPQPDPTAAQAAGAPGNELDVDSGAGVSTREEALEFLARRLHWKMEHLDPTNDPPEWELLSERQREFYRACTVSLFQERRIASIALG